MSKHEGKIRFLAYLDDTRWLWESDIFPVKVWCDGLLINEDRPQPTEEDILEDEFKELDLNDVMEYVLNRREPLVIYPYHYYEVVGTFWVEWTPSHSHEHDDWDFEYGLQDALIQIIPYKTAQKLGLDYTMPVPIQCA